MAAAHKSAPIGRLGLKTHREKKAAEYRVRPRAALEEVGGIYATLYTTQESFHPLVRHASEVITILGADSTILYGSPSVERILGYSPEDLVGWSIFDYVHPDDLERVSVLYRKSLASPGVRVD